MGKRRKIAVLTAQIEESGQTVFLRGLLRSAFSHGYDVSVFSMFQKIQSSLAREKGDSSIYDLINFSLFDAVVLVPNTIHTPGINEEITSRIKASYVGPVICIDKDSDDFRSMFISASHHLYKVVSHLIEDHGMTDIAFLSGKTSSVHTRERYDAYCSAMKDHGLTIDKERIFYGDYWYLSGESIAERLMKSSKGLPQALVCSNDRMAIGACKYFTSHGVKIPEDIAVAGFDSFRDGQHSPLPITSVKVPIYEFGLYVGDCLDDLIAGNEIEDFDVEAELFIGNSCGCHCESLKPEYPLRNSWDTEESRGRVNSVFNHMNEDMMLQNSFSGLINCIFLNTYQIRPFHGLDICINDQWTEERSFFTDRLINIISCGESEDKPDSIDLMRYYDKSEILSDINMEDNEPRSFFFFPLHFESNAFGFITLSYKDPDILPGSDERIWIRNVALGLENYRRKDSLIHKNQIIEAGLNTDPVTGLSNYSGFINESTAIVSKLSVLGDNVGVIVVDIKGLSAINKQHGHSSGDIAINTLANIVSKCFNDMPSFTFCMGNGEIVALRLFKDDPEKGMKMRGDRIIDLVSEYNESVNDDQKIEIYYACGYSKIASEAELEKLVNDTINKKNIKKSTVFGSESGLSDNEAQDEEIVREVLDDNCLTYHFQPIIDARTGEIFSYEALMRSTKEPYPNPLMIIKYAEHMNRLYDVESLTFNNVLDIVESRSDIFDGTRKIFINSIPGQRLQGDDLLRLIQSAQNMRDSIVIEFTEQAELSDDDLRSMKNDYDLLGIQTAIDDYGTGYSNIVNLLRYDPNYLKIDRALLSEIQNNVQKQYFVKQIVRFTHENNIMALAEGVETYDELKTVIELGVDLIQGYYTGKPSKEIVTEIDPKILEEIRKINSTLKDRDPVSVYYAGRESRILLSQLEADGMCIIDVSDNDTGLTDFEIVGVPRVPYNIGLHVHGGFSGHIKIDNSTFKNIIGYDAVIVVEDGSDVTLSFSGDCTMQGSIYVSDDSRVMFAGDGTIKVFSDKKEFYGIGSGRGYGCGTMTFDLSGSMEINCTGMYGIGIGSWENCDIKIVNGKYNIDLNGQESVGVGSLAGSADISLFDSKLIVRSTASNCVAVGSFRNDANVMLNHDFINLDLEGNHLCGIGTAEGDMSTVYITKSNVTCSSLGRVSCAFGVAGTGDSVFTVENAAVFATVRGDTAIAFGTIDHNGIIKAHNSRLVCDVTNGDDKYLGAIDDNVDIVSCDMNFTHNGRRYTIPEIMQMLHKGPPPGKP